MAMAGISELLRSLVAANPRRVDAVLHDLVTTYCPGGRVSRAGLAAISEIIDFLASNSDPESACGAISLLTALSVGSGDEPCWFELPAHPSIFPDSLTPMDLECNRAAHAAVVAKSSFVVRLLDSPQPRIRHDAALLLGHLRSSTVASRVASALISEDDPLVAEALAIANSLLGTTVCIDSLSRVSSKSEMPRLRRLAVAGLALNRERAGAEGSEMSEIIDALELVTRPEERTRDRLWFVKTRMVLRSLLMSADSACLPTEGKYPSSFSPWLVLSPGIVVPILMEQIRRFVPKRGFVTFQSVRLLGTARWREDYTELISRSWLLEGVADFLARPDGNVLATALLQTDLVPVPHVLRALRKTAADLRADVDTDPCETFPEYRQILAEADAYAAPRTPRGMGGCHTFWEQKKKFIRERYGLEWRSPPDLHPESLYD